MKKIIVIGCGASGMMAAVAASDNGADVTIYEKNEKPGKKIYITGKGRCNVTNACADEDFFENVRRNPRFLYSAVYDFDSASVCDFFEKNGCRLKTERGERVFPVSDHSYDITDALTKKLRDNNVRINYGCVVTDILYQDGAVNAVEINGKDIKPADAVIVCTGGLSYESTGSTGDGYRFARELGHKVTMTSPSLVPLEIDEDWCSRLQGLSLKNVSLKLWEDVEIPESGKGKPKKKKPVYEGFGEMLFTHFGVSGPLILTASTYMEADKKYTLELDLKPALSMQQLDKRVLRDFEEGLNKNFDNILGGLLPNKLIPIIIELSGIDPYKRVNEVTKEERGALVSLIKALSMTVKGTRGFNEAVITKGGVSVKEIDPSTMQSKIINGLYFAGEVIDVDALTGGFNLQIAWSTGHLAGENAALLEE